MTPMEPNILSVALSCGLAALLAWLMKSRAVFFFGVAGAAVGLWFAPVLHAEFDRDATIRDQIMVFTKVNLPWTSCGAVIGCAVGWLGRGIQQGKESSTWLWR